MKLRVALYEAMVEAERPGRQWALAASYATVHRALSAIEVGDIAHAAELLRLAHAEAENEARAEDAAREVAHALAKDAAEDAVLDASWGLIGDAMIALEDLLRSDPSPAEQQSADTYTAFRADPIGFVRRFMLDQDAGLHTGSRTTAGRLLVEGSTLRGRVSMRELMDLADVARGGRMRAHRPPGVPRKR
jgi:hypothetical protein